MHCGMDSVHIESSKIRLLNELDDLEETIVRRQQHLEEVLERHKADLAAVQMKVLFCLVFASCVIQLLSVK